MVSIHFFSLLANILAAIQLQVVERKIVVNEKEASCFCIEPFGLRIKEGEQFDVELFNQLKVPTSVHWHGLILPNNQDGVANVTQFPLYPGEGYDYSFPLKQTGTYWMHAHFDLQEQRLLSAPLIIEDTLPYKDKVLFLTDFSFKTPEEIFNELKCRKAGHSDLFDVDYDAFLANGKTLSSPDIFEVASNEKVRLRVINGSAATNFIIDLGELVGEAIAIDGNLIQPFQGSSFELAVAQRIDILVTIPETGGAFPILAIAEGQNRQTGMILTTNGTDVPKIAETRSKKSEALTNRDEASFHPITPLSKKPIDRKISIDLGGQMRNYIWTINQQIWPNVTPLLVKEGERVEITFHNSSMMSHPMHLHGHVFQVTELDGKAIDGPMRDTVLVIPNSTVKIQFDATNRGVWPLHCHILYHQEAGMMTVLRYENFLQPL